MALSRKKLSIIHVARAQLAMEDADYRQLLQRAAGVTSAKDLDEVTFELVLAELRRLGFRDNSGIVHARRAGMASPAQQQRIVALWEFWNGRRDPPHFRRWLEKYWKVSDLRFVEALTASKMIAALEKMARSPKTGGCAEVSHGQPSD